MQEKELLYRNVVLTLRVTEDEAREIRLAARAEQISVSELFRRSVRARAESLVGAK